MAVGGDLDPVDQLAKQLLDGVGVAVLNGPADLGAEGSKLVNDGKLGRAVLQLGGQLLAVGDKFVAALRELGDPG